MGGKKKEKKLMGKKKGGNSVRAGSVYGRGMLSNSKTAHWENLSEKDSNKRWGGET